MYGVALPDYLFGAAAIRDHDEELAKIVGSRSDQGETRDFGNHRQPLLTIIVVMLRAQIPNQYKQTGPMTGNI
jgi:hypothetical protein